MALLEIAISVNNRGRGRIQEGDVVVARKPLGYVGKKEQGDLLWLLIETDKTIEELMPTIRENDTRREYKTDKFITINELNQRGFEFDLTKVRNPAEKYQPGLDVDPDNGQFRKQPTPVNIDSIIRTKPAPPDIRGR